MATLSHATERLCDWAIAGQPGDVHLINAYSVALADSDSEYRQSLSGAFCNFPDGKPLSWATALSRTPLSQVRGPKIFEDAMSQGRARGVRHFLLGSTPETLEALQSSLESRYAGVQIVGSESPPFRTLSEEELTDQDSRIRGLNPHIVWVGLGTPKQDYEVARLAKSGFLAVAVGAAFDFSAGTKPEAPAWMTKVGVEWVFRLASEPRRLWRRYLFGNLRFMWALVVNVAR
ncbi:WecB/TagA/CpsF family glycosyltransferase [Pseudarthrobacter raffinosi]|uniref:WecB/TagA/CpsF family glycosyltransferase n=1 Tax=Pseudarthrobacter raffinosi TaxID=2953651 RepID=UPI0035ABA26E